MEKNDLIAILGILIMLIGAVIFSYIIITEEISSCTSDPVKYATYKIAGSNYSFVVLELYVDKTDKFPTVIHNIDLNNSKK